MTAIETSIETPCIGVCALHPALRPCVGCGRSLDEIARWMRARIMAQLPPRLKAMAGAEIAPAAA